jgi:hypothetical protein
VNYLRGTVEYAAVRPSDRIGTAHGPHVRNRPDPGSPIAHEFRVTELMGKKPVQQRPLSWLGAIHQTRKFRLSYSRPHPRLLIGGNHENMANPETPRKIWSMHLSSLSIFFSSPDSFYRLPAPHCGAFAEDCWVLAARDLVAKPHGSDIQHTTARRGRRPPPTFGVSSRLTIPLRGSLLFVKSKSGHSQHFRTRYPALEGEASPRAPL